MRVTYRNQSNQDYWKERWSVIRLDSEPATASHYPLNFVDKIISISGPASNQLALEAGCGPGRVLLHLVKRGVPCAGYDFVEKPVEAVRSATGLDVRVMDARRLEYRDDEFSLLFAFGLFHNFELADIRSALSEARRVLRPDGLICASFRIDNVSNFVLDWVRQREVRKRSRQTHNKAFHKINLTRREIRKLAEETGFEVIEIEPTVNMPLFYRFKFFRAEKFGASAELRSRANGYQLNRLGCTIQFLLEAIARDQVSQLYVLTARPRRGGG